MIHFNNVVIEGFGSIGNNFVFPLDLKGIHLIKGRNGAGKTSIFNALAWCLYGTNLKGLTNGSIATWKSYRPTSFKGTRVAVYLTKDDIDYCVVRHVKFKGTSYGVKGDNTLMVLKGVKQVGLNEDSTTHENLITTGLFKTDQQGYINRLVGYDYKVFVNSILFGQNMTRLISAGGSEKRKLFEDIFDTVYISQAKEKAKVGYTEKCTDIVVAENDIKGLLKTREILLNQLDKSKKVIKDFAGNKAGAITRKKESRGKLVLDIEGQKEKISNTNLQIEKLQEEKEKAAELVANFDDSNLIKIRSNLKKNKVTLSGLNDDMLFSESELNKHKVKLGDLNKQLLDIESTINNEIHLLNRSIIREENALDKVETKCHACGKPISEDEIGNVRANIKLKIREYKKDIKVLENSTLYVDKQAEITNIIGNDLPIKEYIKSTGLSIAEINIVISDLVVLEEENSKGLVQLEKQFDKVENELASMGRSYRDYVASLGTMEQYLQNADSDLEEAKNLTPPVLDLDSMEAEILKVKYDIIKHEKIIIKLGKERDAFKFWNTKGFASTGTSSYIFAIMMDELNACTHKWAERVGLSIEMGIDLSKASKPFYTKVMLSDGVIVNHKELSGGEQQLVDVCIAFGTHDMVSKTLPLLILDEVFENLDGDNIAKVFDFVRLKVEGGKNVYIITHQDNLDFKYTKTIEVEKVGKLTQILWA